MPTQAEIANKRRIFERRKAREGSRKSTLPTTNRVVYEPWIHAGYGSYEEWQEAINRKPLIPKKPMPSPTPPGKRIPVPPGRRIPSPTPPGKRIPVPPGRRPITPIRNPVLPVQPRVSPTMPRLPVKPSVSPFQKRVEESKRRSSPAAGYRRYR